MRVENQTKARVWEDLSLSPETSTKKLFKNSISDFAAWKADGAAERLPGILSPRPALRDGQGLRLLSHQEIHEGKGGQRLLFSIVQSLKVLTDHSNWEARVGSSDP